jgi:hypothetical protein
LGVCRPYDVYHVTVMPCYDKKLEAVRDDFTFSVDGKEVKEVDSVLTTGEVLDLIQVATWFVFLLVLWLMDLKNKADTYYDLHISAVQIYRFQDSRGIFIGQIVRPCAWCFILCLYSFIFSSTGLLISYNLFDCYFCLQTLANFIPTTCCEKKSM